MEFLIVLFAMAAALFDIKRRIIPNILVLCMLGTWVLIITVLLLIDINKAVSVLIDSGFGLLLGGGIFISVYLVSRKGLGGGDVKFMAAAGLYLGLSSTISAIFYGTVLAALFGIVLILLKKITRKDKMPLAPFLLVGIMITLLLT